MTSEMHECATCRSGRRERDPVSAGEERQQARLRVVLDRKLGRETPDWIREIAES